jgi:putative glutathione S-transferase
MLVNGKWSANWQPVQAKDEKGGFVRQASQFRNWITEDGRPGAAGEGGFPAAELPVGVAHAHRAQAQGA